MSVRVVIERHAKKGKEKELENLLKELRIRGIRQPGYLSGETLQSLDDLSLSLVLSTWATISDWKAWENSPQRREISAKIDPLLASPARTIVFTQI